MPPTISRRPRRPAEQEEEPEVPMRPVRRAVRPAAAAEAQDPETPPADDEALPTPSFRGGWTAGRQNADAVSDFAKSFVPGSNVEIIKFLEDAPYVNFRRHWIERNGANGIVNRPYTCPQTVGKQCPICDLGEKAQAVSSFNVALIGDDGVPTLNTWDVGIKLFNVLSGFHEDPKIGPLTRGYFAVSKTSSNKGSGKSKGGSTQTNVIPVKPTSLQEDYDVTPPNPKEIEALGLYTPDVVTLPKRGELEEIAEEMASQYD